MWRVERIEVCYDTVNTIRKDAIRIWDESFVDSDSDYFVTLVDDETDCSVTIHGCDDINKFRNELAEYNPLGYCPGGFLSKQRVDWCLLFRFDAMSLKFQPLVKWVTPVFANTCDCVGFIHNLKRSATPYGNPMRVFELDSRFGNTDYCGTSLQVLCFLDEGWHDDKFYMRCLTNRCDAIGVCIEFTDPQEARRFVAKAKLMGYNPLDRINKFGRIVHK